jgi:TrmH family RNA methyltransferase
MITSSANGQMKRIALLNRKAKARYEQQVFVAEGMKMCFEAPKASVQAMYVSESFLLDEGRREKLAGSQVTQEGRDEHYPGV